MSDSILYQTTRITFRLPERERSALREIAKTQSGTMSDIIRGLIREYIADYYPITLAKFSDRQGISGVFNDDH